jgi:CDP-6-deoxy-D-xylo-4-hexulose-3-dehydrase
VEDCCEALGAAVRGRRVGGWGVASSFSFFVSHHMTTGEGGMIVTGNESLARAARSLRAFGRAGEPVKDRLRKVSGLGDYDLRYVFSELGYSLKLTEFQAAMGSEQLRKLETFVQTRRRYAKRLHDGLLDFEEWLQLPQEPSGAYHSYFGFPIVIRKSSGFRRSELTNFLESRGIETRPMMAGNIVEHPIMKGCRYRVIGSLRNSRMIARNGFFVGCHPALAEEDIDFTIACFGEFFRERRP